MGYSYEYMNIIRANRVEQFVKINELATVIWNEHYVPIIGNEQVDYMLQWMYDINSLQNQHEEGHIFYIIESEGNELGFISIKEEGTGDWFLNKFYVLTQKQRNGLGSALFKFIVDEHPIDCIRLQVNRQNYKAINFYFKLGFVIEKVDDFDIGNGYFMNDFVMIWNR
jgi:ribosomal protein S18 acetylase RimI-like enzyme